MMLLAFFLKNACIKVIPKASITVTHKITKYNSK